MTTTMTLAQQSTDGMNAITHPTHGAHKFASWTASMDFPSLRRVGRGGGNDDAGNDAGNDDAGNDDGKDASDALAAAASCSANDAACDAIAAAAAAATAAAAAATAAADAGALPPPRAPSAYDDADDALRAGAWAALSAWTPERGRVDDPAARSAAFFERALALAHDAQRSDAACAARYHLLLVRLVTHWHSERGMRTAAEAARPGPDADVLLRDPIATVAAELAADATCGARWQGKAALLVAYVLDLAGCGAGYASNGGCFALLREWLERGNALLPAFWERDYYWVAEWPPERYARLHARGARHYRPFFVQVLVRRELLDLVGSIDTATLEPRRTLNVLHSVAHGDVVTLAQQPAPTDESVLADTLRRSAKTPGWPSAELLSGVGSNETFARARDAFRANGGYGVFGSLLLPEDTRLLAEWYWSSLLDLPLNPTMQRTSAYSDRIAFFLNHRLTPVVQKVLGGYLLSDDDAAHSRSTFSPNAPEVKMAYSFMCHYEPRADAQGKKQQTPNLMVHTDREDNEYTVSVTLKSPLWPIIVGHTPEAEAKSAVRARTPYDDNIATLVQDGDAVIFTGRTHTHWRENMHADIEHFTSILFHYVARDFDFIDFKARQKKNPYI